MNTATAVDRTLLRRVLAVANGKGGVGKTSTSSHLGGQAAAGGRKVLLVDLDPQGNTEDDLGHESDDLGAGMTRAVMLGTDPVVLRDVRPNLDVIPGGVNLSELVDHLQSKRARTRRDVDPYESFVQVIARAAVGYDLVVLDCPPANNEVMQEAALDASRYLLIPTRADMSSRKGIVQMAQRFMEMRGGFNPSLVLLGVLLFEIGSRARLVERSARDWIDEALQGQAPVFDTTIRHVEATALEGRERGLLAHELAETSAGKSSLGLAGDYRDMAVEVFQRLVGLEQAAA